jgi:hypothetical protein
MLTSGTLSALQEVLASFIAGDKNRHGSYLTPRVPKMAIYGSLISAPLGHILVTALQKAFAGRTSTRAKIMQILVSNLVVSPIQNTVYLACMAVIAGARKVHQVRATVEAGFFPVMKVSWCTSPIALIIAQKFLPPHAWVPFFNMVAFVIGTYINASTKKKRLAAISKKKKVRSRLTASSNNEYYGRADVDTKKYEKKDERYYDKKDERYYDKKDEKEYYVRRD